MTSTAVRTRNPKGTKTTITVTVDGVVVGKVGGNRADRATSVLVHRHFACAPTQYDRVYRVGFDNDGVPEAPTGGWEVNCRVDPYAAEREAEKFRNGYVADGRYEYAPNVTAEAILVTGESARGARY